MAECVSFGSTMDAPAFEDTETETDGAPMSVPGDNLQPLAVAGEQTCQWKRLVYSLLKETKSFSSKVKVGRTKYLSVEGKKLKVTDASQIDTFFQITYYQCYVNGKSKKLVTLRLFQKDDTRLYLSARPDCKDGKLPICLDEFRFPILQKDGERTEINNDARHLVFTLTVRKDSDYFTLGPMDFPHMCICVCQDYLVCLDQTHEAEIAKFDFLPAAPRKASVDSGLVADLFSHCRLEGVGGIPKDDSFSSRSSSGSVESGGASQVPCPLARKDRSSAGEQKNSGPPGNSSKSQKKRNSRINRNIVGAERKAEGRRRDRRNIQMCCTVS